MGWLSGYTTRRKLTVNHAVVDTALVNFPVDVILRPLNFDFAKSLANGHDIRFTAADGTTLLDYERERHDNVGLKAEYKVRLPSISSTTPTEFFLYQRTEATPDGANPTAVWGANSVARLGLQEDPSGTAPQMKDSTINANHGTTHGAMTAADSVEGKIGRALSFDGVDDYVLITHDGSLKFQSGDFTVAVWATLTTWGAFFGLITTDIAGDAAWRIHRDIPSNFLSAFFGGVTLHYPSILLGDWHQYAFTKRETTLTLYFEGTEVASVACPATHPVSGTELGLGSYRIQNAKDGTHMFNGLIDEVRIYNRALSAAEIKASFNSGNNTLLTFGAEVSIAADTIQSIWNTRQTIGDTLQSTFNVRALASDTLQSVWNVVTSVSNTLQSIFNVRAIVSKTDQYIWNVRVLAGKANQAIWSVRSTISDTLQSIFNVYSVVSNTNQYLWNVIGQVGDTLQSIWNVRQTVSNTIQAVFSVRTVVGKANQYMYNIRVLADDTLQTIFNIRAVTSKTNQYLWNVVGFVLDRILDIVRYLFRSGLSIKSTLATNLSIKSTFKGG